MSEKFGTSNTKEVISAAFALIKGLKRAKRSNDKIELTKFEDLNEILSDELKTEIVLAWKDINLVDDEIKDADALEWIGIGSHLVEEGQEFLRA